MTGIAKGITLVGAAVADLYRQKAWCVSPSSRVPGFAAQHPLANRRPALSSAAAPMASASGGIRQARNP